jgi:hypothetical protein
MLEPDRERDGIETAITLVTLKPTDNVDSLDLASQLRLRCRN